MDQYFGANEFSPLQPATKKTNLPVIFKIYTLREDSLPTQRKQKEPKKKKISTLCSCLARNCTPSARWVYTGFGTGCLRGRGAGEELLQLGALHHHDQPPPPPGLAEQEAAALGQAAAGSRFNSSPLYAPNLIRGCRDTYTTTHLSGTLTRVGWLHGGAEAGQIYVSRVKAAPGEKKKKR